VLNSITAVIAALESADGLKILAGRAECVRARLTTVDVWEGGGIRQIDQPAPDPECSACGARDFAYLAGRRRAPVSLCGRNAVQIHERARPIDLAQLNAALLPLGEVRANEFALRFLAGPYEMTIFPDGRAIIKGTTDIGLARSLYARYLGA
jgi:adenylyltransferase/sulfurtransferase